MRFVFLSVVLALGSSVFARDEPAATKPPAKAERPFIPQVAREAATEGNAAFLRKDYAVARKAYEKLLGLAPDNMAGLINLGMVEFAAGNFAAADKTLKRALSIELSNASAWQTLGIMEMEQGHLDAALANLAQAALYDPPNARTRNYLGVVMGRKKWIDGAQDELRKAVEIDPDFADAHFNLAMSYLENDPPAIELARRHYYRAVDLGAAADPEVEKILKTAPAPEGGETPAAKNK